jgi:putative serine protease PepD
VLPSVVTLKTKAGDESELGSGIVLTSDGLIMTNNHGGPSHPRAQTAIILSKLTRACRDPCL